VSGFVQVMDGEKDPRCLVNAFWIFRTVLNIFPRSAFENYVEVSNSCKKSFDDQNGLLNAISRFRNFSRSLCVTFRYHLRPQKMIRIKSVSNNSKRLSRMCFNEILFEFYSFLVRNTKPSSLPTFHRLQLQQASAVPDYFFKEFFQFLLLKICKICEKIHKIVKSCENERKDSELQNCKIYCRSYISV